MEIRPEFVEIARKFLAHNAPHAEVMELARSLQAEAAAEMAFERKANLF